MANITAVTDVVKVISLLGRSKTGHARFRQVPATTKTEGGGRDWKTEEKTRTEATSIEVVLKRQKTEQYGGSTFTVYFPAPVHRLVIAPGMSLLKILLSKPSSVAKGVSMRNGLALRLMREKRNGFQIILEDKAF
ncbi:hypothetical protein YC2023_073266 [Brassica napus]